MPLPSNFDASTDVLNIGYGFLNGIVDVFPTESLPNYCRTNSTNTYWQVYRVFVDNQYDYAVEEDVYQFTLGIQDILQFPYFVSFNCYYAQNQVFVAEDPWADGQLTEEERLKTSIIIVNDYLTNLVFNVGYMYKDVLNFVTQASTNANYFENMGYYFGDFAIRIFWRKDFLTTFVY